MKKKYQNAFFIFGLLVLIVMASQLDFREVWAGVQHAGYWFFNAVMLWFFLYFFNTASWYLIINTIGNDQGVCRRCKVGFMWLYKITVSAFALNYATPGGLMGGEPYRIMSLSPKIGTKRASSSVILFVMTHIYSHFWFWLLSVPLYILTQKMTPLTYILLPIIAAVALLAIWFFQRGYRKGIAVTGMNILSHFPMVKRWAQPFVERNKEKLAEVDAQIAALHNQNPRTFTAAVILWLFGDVNVILTVALAGIAVSAIHGVNLMLICDVPGRFGRYGRISTVSGVLNMFTYVGSAASTYGFALIVEAFDWKALMLAWVLIDGIGILMLLLAMRRWKRFITSD